MRLLVYKWRAVGFKDLLYVLTKLNIDYDLFEYDFDAPGHSKHYDEEFVDYFVKNIDYRKYDAIFSIAYWATLSDAAMKTGLKYISWSYDSPLDTKDPLRTFGNECNYMFLFDKVEADKYINQGIDTVYHLPLGVNVDRYSKVKSYDKKCDIYRTDVSFVGSLYKAKLPNLKQIVSERTADILQRIVDTQRNMPGMYILNQMVTEAFTNAVNLEIESLHDNISGDITRAGLENTLAYDVTNYNRLILLSLCAKRFKTDLYTGSEVQEIPELIIRGTVNYYDEMPWVFAASKINLNSTLISIQSGLPQRVLDIMASGGFLLSNHQSEFDDEFEDGKDLALFTTYDEAIEKINYYLSHNDEREIIVKNGRFKIFERYSLEDRIKQIMQCVLE